MRNTANISTTKFSVNGLSYTPPARPVVVICVDGCGDEYLSTSLAQGRMPNLARVIPRGYRGMVRGALPSFTNVNNASITTGMPPAVTGFGGEFLHRAADGRRSDDELGQYLRCGTILAAAAQAGRKVAMVTAKNKLLDILSHELDGIAFSSEFANQAEVDTHGIGDVEQLVGQPTPPIYSAEASLFVLAAGAKLIEHGMSDFSLPVADRLHATQICAAHPRIVRLLRRHGHRDRNACWNRARWWESPPITA